MPSNLPPPLGRGARLNPPNRFAPTYQDAAIDPQIAEDPDFIARLGRPGTSYFPYAARHIITYNDSPDVGFGRSINPYAGCSHGCVYCYARPTHEYLGMSSGLDFETKILVKHDAARLLRRELAHPHYTPDTLGLCGVTDPYQPIERKLELTRGVLQILVECHHPVGIVTKNHLVTRDIDLLRQLARDEAVAVYLSITTLDPSLTRVMEPRTSVPRDRLAALRALAEAGVPCGVLMAPVIPGLTDHELPNILQAAAEHGACCAGFVPLRLPHAVATLFVDFLEQHFPDRKEKVLRRIREMRGGALNDPRFGSRMRGEGIFAEQWRAMFHTYAARLGLSHHGPNLTAAHFVPPPPLKGQLLLFDQT